MSETKEIMDKTITVRELQRLTLDPDDVLLVKLGVEEMDKKQIDLYCANVGAILRENLPNTKIVITTVTFDRPFDVEVIRQEINDQ